MEYAIGIALALVTVGMGRAAGFDRERSFYPLVLIVIASYYVLFATMAATRGPVLFTEIIVATGFTLCAVIGYRTAPWIVVAGLAGHGLFDLIHSRLVDNPGVPRWWPGFCLTFDLAAAVAAGWALLQRHKSAARVWSDHQLRATDFTEPSSGPSYAASANSLKMSRTAGLSRA